MLLTPLHQSNTQKRTEKTQLKKKDKKKVDLTNQRQSSPVRCFSENFLSKVQPALPLPYKHQDSTR